MIKISFQTHELSLDVLARSLCYNGVSTFNMIMDLDDTRSMMHVLCSIGVEVHRLGSKVVVNPNCVRSFSNVFCGIAPIFCIHILVCWLLVYSSSVWV